MLAHLLRRLTYANVMATLALFIALGGSSYAALRIGSRQIADNTIRSKDIRNNEVRSGDVRNRSLLAKDFKAGQLAQGAKGDPGATGPPGPSVAGYAVSRPGVASLLPSDSSFGSTVTLNTGTDKSGPISVSFPARLIITGTTRMQNGDGSSRSMRCRLVLNPGAAQQLVSAEASQSVPSLAAHTSTVTGAVDVASGTYNVGMECATQLSNASGLYSDVSITVVAVGR